jgi:prepilin-type N-terminal cleavage/methylation domain-containing protein
MTPLFIQKKKLKARGFTLVETLVAVAILMISIAGPLVVASKGLNAAIFARDQMMASYLAQESLELIKNIRDNNVVVGDSWVDGIEMCVSQAAACDLTASDFELTTCNGNAGGCQLYYDPTRGYNSRSAGRETIFKRYFYLVDEENTSIPEKRVKVVVKWNHGTLENEIVLMSVILDAKR